MDLGLVVFGEHDLYLIADRRPDQATVAAWPLIIQATGMLAIKTAALLTAAEIAAANKTGNYRPPGVD